MSSTPGGWAMPDFGIVLIRSRLVNRLGRSGTKPCLVFGSSGSGKTVVAAQHCLAGNRATIWIDAAGDFLSVDRVSMVAVQALGGVAPSRSEQNMGQLQAADYISTVLASIGATAADMGVNVVIDDSGLPSDESAVDDLDRLARALRTCSSRLVVTSRSTDGWPARTLCGWDVVGPEDLALTDDEAIGLAESVGLDHIREQAADLRSACAGHVALFTVLANQVALHGVDSATARTASLAAWLTQLLHSEQAVHGIEALGAVALLGTGTASDLLALGVSNPEDALVRLSASLPLIACARDKAGNWSFRCHDLVHDFVIDELARQNVNIADDVVEAVIGRLTRSGNSVRAMSIMRKLGQPEFVSHWLEENGQAALSDGLYMQLQQSLELMPVHVLMSRPRVLMLWAELAAEQGQMQEALSKCQAARALTEHSGDSDTLERALSLSMQCLCRLYRFDEAVVLSGEVLESGRWPTKSRIRGEALMCLARARLTRGEEASSAAAVLREAIELSDDVEANSHTRHTLTFLSALVPILSDGDWTEGARIISPLLHVSGQLVSSRIMTMGNLGLMLTETGRLTRSQSLLRTAVAEARRFGLDSYVGAYSPPLGYAAVGAGAIGEGIGLIEEGIQISSSLGDSIEAATDRVHFSTVLRSVGQFDQALVAAEQAFEVLSPTDNIGFRRLAALEIAASLLALGDDAAAGRWLETLDGGPNQNPYHMCRLAMVKAIRAEREGQSDGAVEELERYGDHLVSGNSNWQVAMYCRAFPDLLGLVAAAVGPENLPAHMLRMVLPEHSERSLSECRELLSVEDWKVLGTRLLGTQELANFQARGGLPLCHVRMFGGLVVNVGGRGVSDRDWRKRKARILFCMLAVRNGQEVARDRLFEHLWPDMDEERARGNMYVVWSAIKSALNDSESDRKRKCPYVESLGGVCRSVRDHVRTDVGAFDDEVARARAATASGNRGAALSSYRALVDIYQGELLPGDLYDDWFGPLREHYRIEFIDAMVSATRILLDEGDPFTALMYARRALQQDSSREDLYQQVLRCQIAAGQRSSAIDTYMVCKARLSEDLGLDPSPETRALYGDILAMEDAEGMLGYDPLTD